MTCHLVTTSGLYVGQLDTLWHNDTVSLEQMVRSDGQAECLNTTLISQFSMPCNQELELEMAPESQLSRGTQRSLPPLHLSLDSQLPEPLDQDLAPPLQIAGRAAGGPAPGTAPSPAASPVQHAAAADSRGEVVPPELQEAAAPGGAIRWPSPAAGSDSEDEAAASDDEEGALNAASKPQASGRLPSDEEEEAVLVSDDEAASGSSSSSSDSEGEAEDDAAQDGEARVCSGHSPFMFQLAAAAGSLGRLLCQFTDCTIACSFAAVPHLLELQRQLSLAENASAPVVLLMRRP